MHVQRLGDEAQSVAALQDTAVQELEHVLVEPRRRDFWIGLRRQRRDEFPFRLDGLAEPEAPEQRDVPGDREQAIRRGCTRLLVAQDEAFPNGHGRGRRQDVAGIAFQVIADGVRHARRAFAPLDPAPDLGLADVSREDRPDGGVAQRRIGQRLHGVVVALLLAMVDGQEFDARPRFEEPENLRAVRLFALVDHEDGPILAIRFEQLEQEVAVQETRGPRHIDRPRRKRAVRAQGLQHHARLADAWFAHDPDVTQFLAPQQPN
ncbi:hypothetical protein D3C86_972780 [compost metagenome]